MTSLDDKAAREKFLKQLAEAEQYRDAKLIPQWEKFWTAYMGTPDLPKKNARGSWRSRNYVKHMFQQVQTLLVEFVRYETELDFIPETQLDVEWVEANENIVASQLYEDSWDTKKVDATVNALVYGGQPVLTTWDYACVNRKEQVPGGVAGQSVSRKVPLRDRPTDTLIDPERFLFDPTASELDKRCRYAGYQYFALPDEIKNLGSQTNLDGSPVYKNLDLVANRSGKRGSGAGKSAKWIGRSDEQKPDGCEVITWYSRNTDGSIRLQVVVDRNVIIRDEAMAPQWHLQEGELPFTMLRVMRDPKNMYGLSVVWSSKEIQDQIWAIMNAGMDALRLLIQPFMWKNKNDPKLKDVEIRPGGSAWSQDPANAMVPFRPAGVEPFVTEQALQNLVALMERMTGANASLSGMGSDSSATQANQNLEQSKGRVGMELKQMDLGVARMVSLRRALNRQYLSPTEAFRLAGPDGVSWMSVSLNVINANYTIRPKGSADRALMSQRQQNAQNQLNALMPVMQAPNMPDGTVFDAKRAVMAFLEANNVKNAKDYFVQPPPPPDPAPEPPPDASTKARISESINFKDLPGDAQAALLQMVGLPSAGAAQQPPVGSVNGSVPPGPVAAGQAPSGPAPGQ